MNHPKPRSASPSAGLDLDKQRVTVLLLINTILIQNAMQIQQQIQIVSKQQPAAAASISSKLSELLQQILKRLHANLTCIGELSERQNKPNDFQLQRKEIFPAILTTIPELQELLEHYNQLRLLFPVGLSMLQRGITNNNNNIQPPMASNQFQQHQQQYAYPNQIPFSAGSNQHPQFSANSSSQSQMQDQFQRQQQLRMLQHQQLQQQQLQQHQLSQAQFQNPAFHQNNIGFTNQGSINSGMMGNNNMNINTMSMGSQNQNGINSNKGQGQVGFW
ncbi:hypothetical protein WICPIJ_001013 [Wickerhamomyces pijperi]|uniref:Uncharacterized protein n=1 Tax=Wickerhamomyces pijperi TaxID=599730 RepID=A0A9P8QET0_WICPI|nr:hypothetical protein WICPIJ_001013 [Wickerhamomyces pijperi]